MCGPQAHEHDSKVENVPHCLGCVDDPVAELDSWQKNAAKEIAVEDTRLEIQTVIEVEKGQNEDSGSDIEIFEDNTESKPKNKMDTSIIAAKQSIENQKLQNMGLQTAIAIALHNFPEGLATFVAVLNEPKVGVILAIAIGIHNITPCVLCNWKQVEGVLVGYSIGNN